MVDLIAKSLDVIRAGQHASGAFVASPTYAPYGKAWLRDGAFCAMALDRFGESDRAAAFHQWVARVVRTEEGGLARPSRRSGHFLRARYPLAFPDAAAGADDWGNFQLDGPGLWLVALADHLARNKRDLAPYRDAAAAVGRYLDALGDQPCYDCWEERGDDIHGSSLAAIAGGLRALVDLGLDTFSQAAQVAQSRFESLAYDGSTFVKLGGSSEVDSSLLWCASPCHVIRPDDPRMARTTSRVRRELRDGRTRYRGDSYFGGGEWLLLAGLAGWHAVGSGDAARAREQLAWIEAHAEADGSLPEQVLDHLERPETRARWIGEYGPPASPLLWSHAMYLILRHALAEGA